MIPQTTVAQIVLDTFRASVAKANTGRPDFLEWIDERGWITSPKADDSQQIVIPFKLWESQEEIARWLIAGYDLGINKTLDKAREQGATWLAMHAAYYLFKFEHRFSALMVSRKDELVDDGTEESLFGKVRFIHSMQPVRERPAIKDSHRRIINLDNDSLLKGESTNIALGRSTRYAVVITDEWAFVDKTKTKRIKVSLETVSRSWWRISTHNGKGTAFHKSCIVAQSQSEGLPLEERTYLKRDWRGNPAHDEEWYDNLLVENGGELTWDEREQEHNCSPAGVSGTRVWKFDREACEYGEEELLAMTHNGEPVDPRRDWMWVGMMDFGSGPSWTVFTVCLIDYREPGRPHFWFDLCLVFESEAVSDIASTIKERVRGVYSHSRMISGDPAGRNRESDQESWESNLRRHGIPIRCLPAKYNERAMIDIGLKDFQKLLDQGRIHIHRERAAVFAEAVESWEWAIPDGLDPEMVSRDVVSPKKNWPSHPCDTGRYTTSAVLRMKPKDRGRVDRVAKSLPRGAGAQVSDMYNRAVGTGLMNGGKR